MLNLDWTLPVASVVFLVTLWALNRLLFRPLWAVLDERKERIEGPRSQAEALREEARRLAEDCEGRVREARRQGFELGESLRRESLKQRQERLQQARAEAEKRVAEVRQAVSRDLEAARGTLRRNAEEVARLIALRILEAS